MTDRSARLTGSVDANGAPTTYRFEYGPTTAYGGTTPTTGAGSGTGAVAAAATLDGLSAGATYHYRLVAFNGGGVSRGGDRTFTTASSPQPAATYMVPTSTTPFAGVRLVSTRLSFGGRFVALKLSCPAGTVGRCSGRTKLTARRRAAAGGARSVTLGRAPFSIASGGKAKVNVSVPRAGRRLLNRVRRLRAKNATAARDGAGNSKTTVASVTIRRRER